MSDVQATSPVVKFVSQSRLHGDCMVCSFAMMFAISYEEALVLIVRVQPKVLKEGVTAAQLRRVAKSAGVVLRELQQFDCTEDSEQAGILIVESRATNDMHATYFRFGLIFDGSTECVWEIDTYLAVHNYKPYRLLVRE